MGIVPINTFQVCLKSLPNFRSKNPTTFCLIFVAEILQYFALFLWQKFNSTSPQMCHSTPNECYSHQAFDVKIRKQGCLIFVAKIRQSFVFGALWHTGRVLRLYIQRVLMCSHRDEPKPSKVLSMLIHVTYMGKPLSLSDMDQDNHTAMIMHTIQHEYAPTTIALSAYPYYKVKSSLDQRGSLTQPQESIIQSAQSPIYKQIQIYIHHTKCNHTKKKSKSDIANVPRVWSYIVQEM